MIKVSLHALLWTYFVLSSDIPLFTKTPKDVQAQLGTTAQLECHAAGPPNLVLSWQKDGVSNFPAIQEKRWHVEPAQSVTFISVVKKIDEGTYSCVATNQDGTIMANATVTVIGECLSVCKCVGIVFHSETLVNEEDPFSLVMLMELPLFLLSLTKIGLLTGDTKFNVWSLT